MSFTWKELTCIGLFNKLGDIELVIYLMKNIIPIRNKYIEEESRKFHIDRMISCKEDTLYKMELNHSINYMYSGFLKEYNIRFAQGHVMIELDIKDKIKCINKLYKEAPYFLNGFNIDEVIEALWDRIYIDDISDEPTLPYLHIINNNDNFHINAIIN